MNAMKRLQFNLRQLLILLPVIAVVLVLARYAMRSPGLAIGLLIAGIGAVVLVVVNNVVFVLLRVAGEVLGRDAESRSDSRAGSAESRLNSRVGLAARTSDSPRRLP